MATLDLASYAAVLVTFLLGVCIAILFFFMRDREHAPLHTVRRLVWCPRHERTAMVEFNERIQTGLAAAHGSALPAAASGRAVR